MGGPIGLYQLTTLPRDPEWPGKATEKENHNYYEGYILEGRGKQPFPDTRR
jgi:hypothetical protein